MSCSLFWTFKADRLISQTLKQSTLSWKRPNEHSFCRSQNTSPHFSDSKVHLLIIISIKINHFYRPQNTSPHFSNSKVNLLVITRIEINPSYSLQILRWISSFCKFQNWPHHFDILKITFSFSLVFKITPFFFKH